MQTFRQRMFLRFFLQHNTGARTPAALQVDRSNVVPIRPAKPAATLRTRIQKRADGFKYIKVVANVPRPA